VRTLVGQVLFQPGGKTVEPVRRLTPRRTGETPAVQDMQPVGVPEQLGCADRVDGEAETHNRPD
jgi:hypothetical protein